MKHYTWVLIMLSLFAGVVPAQEPFGRYDFDYERGMRGGRMDEDSLVCAWPKVGLRDTPGERGQYVQTIYFGEQVRLYGNNLRRASGKNYIQVETNTGRVGWVDQYYFISEGGLVTLLKNKTIYEAPSPVTATSGEFKAGDLLILSDYQDGNWVELVSEGRRKIGWVKGIDEVSFSAIDIEFAKLYQDAIRMGTETQRLRELEKIRRMPDIARSGLEPIITFAALEYSSPGREAVITDPNTDEIIYYDDGSGEVRGGETKQAEVVVEKVIDMETGRYYNRVTETGMIAEVNGPKKPKSIYWAYHKTRPVGSKILLHVPEGGYLQLEVVARLRKDNPASIGLGKQVLEAIYGTRHAKWADFSYPQ